MAKRIVLLVLFLAAAAATLIWSPINELCKLLREKPGVTVFFQYQVPVGVEANNLFKAEVKNLETKLTKEGFKYKIGQSGYALTGSNPTTHYAQGDVTIETERGEIDKIRQFLDQNFYQNGGTIMLKSLRCQYKSGYNLHFHSGR